VYDTVVVTITGGSVESASKSYRTFFGKLTLVMLVCCASTDGSEKLNTRASRIRTETELELGRNHIS